MLVSSMTVGTAGYDFSTGSTSNRTISLGSGGLVLNNSGVVTLGRNTTTGGSSSAGVVSLTTAVAATLINISGSGTLKTTYANVFDATRGLSLTNATVDDFGYDESVISLTGNSASKITNSDTTYTSNLSITGTASTTFAGVIEKLIAINKSGSGTLTLSGSNTYTGVTTVSGGTLSTTTLANGGSASGIGQSPSAAANLLLGNGTTLQYTGATTISDRLVTINGTAAGNSATLDASGTGALNLTNAGSLAYGTTNQTRTLILSGSNTSANTLAATVGDNGTGATTITKSGAGTWVLSGTNSYTGGTNINNGILSLVSGIQVLGGNGTIATIGTINFGGGTLQYSVSNNTDYSSRFSGGTNQLFSIDTNGQNVSFGALLKGSGSTLTKLGSGTLTLASTGTSSAYTGGTTITGGTLLFTGTSGTPVGTGSVSIGAAGTLASGTGTTTTVVGLVTTAATTSIIAPGATATSNTGTVGALSLAGGLNLAAGATIPFDLGINSDLISITGGTFTGGTAASSVTFAFNNLGATDGTTYALINYTGATATGVDLTDFTSTGIGGTFVFNGTELDFIASVPEPATILGGLLTVGLLGYNQRRRLRAVWTGEKKLRRAA